MTVGELREALAGLPGDMRVMLEGDRPGDGLVVATMRMHYAGEATEDFLWLAWSGSWQKFKVQDDGEVVHQFSGYHPALISVRHDDDSLQYDRRRP